MTSRREPPSKPPSAHREPSREKTSRERPGREPPSREKPPSRGGGIGERGGGVLGDRGGGLGGGDRHVPSAVPADRKEPVGLNMDDFLPVSNFSDYRLTRGRIDSK